MLPIGSPSSTPVKGEFLSPDDATRSPLIDYERGGVHLNDPSQGLDYQNWKVYYESGSVKISTVTNTDVTILFTADLITEVSLAFDQNMRPAVAYVQDGVAKYRWFDPFLNAIDTIVLTDAKSPMTGLDDKRFRLLSDSDIILCYLKSNALYYRLQRERFIIEHLMGPIPIASVQQITNVGMTTRNRFEIVVKTQG